MVRWKGGRSLRDRMKVLILGHPTHLNVYQIASDNTNVQHIAGGAGDARFSIRVCSNPAFVLLGYLMGNYDSYKRNQTK